mmetsp:Transcript_3246/g.6375  ORF Transcript_3246/g.6375 Transcript_3246/m.6375 type:complete len:205 (+) Transcript_3246:239-853(+)
MMPRGRSATHCNNVSRFFRRSSSSAITNIFSMKSSTGSAKASITFKNSEISVLEPVILSFSSATLYASYSAFSSFSMMSRLSSANAPAPSLPRIRRVGRARAVITLARRAPPSSAFNATTVLATSAGSDPRSDTTARTASTLFPASTRSCSSLRSTNASASASTASVTSTGCTSAAALSAKGRSIRMLFCTAVCKKPYVTRRRP